MFSERCGKVSHNVTPCDPPIARKTFWITFDDFGRWVALPTIFSVNCNIDSELLISLQTVDAVVRTQRHCRNADTFPMFWSGWIW